VYDALSWFVKQFCFDEEKKKHEKKEKERDFARSGGKFVVDEDGRYKKRRSSKVSGENYTVGYMGHSLTNWRFSNNTSQRRRVGDN